WTYVSSVFIIPENTTRASFGLYFLKGSTGTVWFDELFVRVEQPALYESYISYPNYRGLTTPDNNTPWQINISGEIPADAKGARIQSTLHHTSGKIIAEEQIDLAPGKYTRTIDWKPLADLALGNYQWDITFASLDGK